MSEKAIPRCGILSTWTAHGYEHDCKYEFAPDCEHCICVTAEYGDYTGIDPTTGKRFSSKKETKR